jgi:Protein of unknown function (DUF2752)
VTTDPTHLATSNAGRWIAPAASALGGAALVAFARFQQAHGRTVFPPCPFHAATGLWCPGCGLTRGTLALLRGNVQQALGFNLLTPFVLFAIVYAWAQWAVPRVGGSAIPLMSRIPANVWKGIGAVVIVFSVARNLPIGPLAALAP